MTAGLTPRGVSGLKSAVWQSAAGCPGLTPRGVSGLKYLIPDGNVAPYPSHPSRGEWIEISIVITLAVCAACLTPRGVSGLKSLHDCRISRSTSSHPSRGGWIEIIITKSKSPHGVSLPWDKQFEFIKDVIYDYPAYSPQSPQRFYWRFPARYKKHAACFWSRQSAFPGNAERGSLQKTAPN